jgi:propionyl-CoA carboxylase beta chain
MSDESKINDLEKDNNDSTTKSKIEDLEQKRQEVLNVGDPSKQHKKQKYTARERLDLLLDPGTFTELGTFIRQQGEGSYRPYGDAVITGSGRINGRLVYVFAQDFTVMGGSLGKAHAEKIVRIFDLALQNGAPIIGIIDSGGARIQEGVHSLGGYGDIFFRNVRASGVIPQISAILGPAAGGAVYSPAITDFVIMTEDTSYMFVTGPQVVKEVMGEETDFNELGGTYVHAHKSGVVHWVGNDEEETFSIIRTLLSYLPQNNLEDPPFINPSDDKGRLAEDLNFIMPDDPKQAYDMIHIIERVVDDGEFFQVHKSWAQNIIVGFARLNGYVIGIVANQPLVLAGAIDIEASIKAARFIRFCDSFNIPIITFVDVPGFLPGLDQEHSGIIRNGSKLLFAFAEASIPKITVVTRKAYGGAYIVMNSKHLGCDVNFAWPTAEIAVMGAEGAVKILYGKKLRELPLDDRIIRETELAAEYRHEFSNPYAAAEAGFIDDVIIPSNTRPKLIEALWPLLTKREYIPKKKHGNIPL